MTPTNHQLTAEQSSRIKIYGFPDGKAEQRIGFYLLDTFGMFPFIAALEPLRAANRYSGRDIFSWHFYGETDQPALCNNGMLVPVDCSIADASQLDRIIVCGSHEPQLPTSEDTYLPLRRLAAEGTILGAVDTGTFLLARANLIKDHRCTLHWEYLAAFCEEFPSIHATKELFEIDKNLFTCAGGSASLDMMVTIIRELLGNDMACRVSELFISSSIRGGSEPQRMDVQHRYGVYHKGLVECIELMEANIEQPLTTQELANCIDISKRQLERLFRAHLQTTPTHYYQNLRLKESKQLLEQTTMSIVEVAVACGFLSAGHFSKRFRLKYGCTPRTARENYANLLNIPKTDR